LKAVCSAIVPAYQSIKSFDDFWNIEYQSY
jgi:hypothetical protein